MRDDWSFLNFQLAPDEMTASLGSAARSGVQRLPDAEALERFLTQLGVVQGRDREALEACARDLAAGAQPIVPRVVAQGQPPQAGVPGSVQRCFRTELQVGRLEAEGGADGAIDYRDRGLIVNVEADQVLLEIQPPVPPQPGRTVTGRALAAPAAEPLAVPRAGVNVRVSASGRQYLAQCRGHVVEEDGALHVRDRFVLAGSVDFTTGNLIAYGSVEVHKNVGAGFRVEAGGDIRVLGAVEAGAALQAGGDIEIGGKVAIGREQGGLRAGGKIAAREVVNSQIDAEGDVVITDVLLNSLVRCRGRFLALEGAAAVRGCDIEAIRGIAVGTVGSDGGAPNTLAVGLTRDVAARIKAIRAEIQEATQIKEHVFRSFAADWPDIKGKAAVEALDPAERARYETGKRDARERQEVQDDRINALRQEQRELEERLFEDKSAGIRIEHSVYPVCHIFVWELDHCVMSRPTGPASYTLDAQGRKIVIGKAVAEADAPADETSRKARELERQVRALAEQVAGKRITSKKLVAESQRLIAEGAAVTAVLPLHFKAMAEQRFQTEDLAAHINWLLLEGLGAGLPPEAAAKLRARGLPLADLALRLESGALRPLALKARLLAEMGRVADAALLARELGKRWNQLAAYEHKLETIYHYAAMLVALACPQGRAQPGADKQLAPALRHLKEVLAGPAGAALTQAAQRQVERIRAILGG